MRDQDNRRQKVQIKRRELMVAGGASLVGATLFGSLFDFGASAQGQQPMGMSDIHPALADHVRREAIKAADELKRAA